MARRYTQSERIRARLALEQGTIFKQAPLRVALVYPSPYTVGMSSLGFQTIYRTINNESPFSAERAFLPEADTDAPLLRTYESQSAVGDFDVIGFSLAYEPEITGVMSCLELAGLAPFSADRRDDDPLVVIGGPLTFSNPIPAGPLADVIIMGEGEELILEVLTRVEQARSREVLLDDLAGRAGFYVPSRHGERLLPVAAANDECLPAFSQIVTPDTELANMHLVEAERGCHRRCTFCVMRRSTNGGMRTASPERVLGTIPEGAPRVGLVGAAVTDHPKLLDIVDGIVSSGRGIGISSLRADRLKPELVALLKAGGYRTLTVASDGASERLRKDLQKSIRAHHLRHAAEMVAQNGLRTLKLYMMLGVPGEEDDDLIELIAFTRELSTIAPIAMTVSPFVAKRNTPLDGQAFAGVDVVDRRLKILRQGLKGVADLRSTSAKWAWVEYCLAQGGFEMTEAARDARAAGGSFGAWRKAVTAHAPHMLDHLYRERTSKRSGPRSVDAGTA